VRIWFEFPDRKAVCALHKAVTAAGLSATAAGPVSVSNLTSWDCRRAQIPARIALASDERLRLQGQATGDAQHGAIAAPLLPEIRLRQVYTAFSKSAFSHQ